MEALAELDRSDLAEWLMEQEWSEFAMSLSARYERNGGLTEPQWRAAGKMYETCRARFQERLAQRRADVAAGTVTPARTGVDLSRLFDGTEADRLVLRAPEARTSLIVDRGQRRWDGWFFVRDGETEERLGSQRPGQTYTGTAEGALAWAVENRVEAFSLHGHATGHCGICSRPLSNPESVERGIGPICYGRIA